jgi:hypothetical protein
VKGYAAGQGNRQQPRIGAPDPALTPNAGLAAVSELCGRLGVINALDAAVGPIKQRDRGFGAGELLAGIAAAQLAGEDFLTGLDRQRADAAGQQLAPVPGLSSTTAAGLARRLTSGQWLAVEAGLAAVTGRSRQAWSAAFRMPCPRQPTPMCRLLGATPRPCHCWSATRQHRIRGRRPKSAGVAQPRSARSQLGRDWPKVCYLGRSPQKRVVRIELSSPRSFWPVENG